MIAAILPVRLTKELGALVPTWIVAVVVVGAGAVIGGGTLVAAGVVAFVVASVALGAQSVGHEYTYGTLGVLLAQPVDRRRLFAIKLGALAVLLILLMWSAWLLMSLHPEVISSWFGLHPVTLLAVPALAFFVAPVLTMVARGVLPGAVFTLAVPVLLLVAGDLTGLAMHGSAAAARVDAVKIAVFWWGMIAACVLGGAAGWRTFVQLEATDGPRGGVLTCARTRRSARVGGPRLRHRFILLAAKELHIQQMTFVIAGLYALLALTAAWIESMTPGATGTPLAALTVLHVASVALLAGALASAEERQFGTLEWQVLLPMASSLQWAMKAGVAFGCALLLGAGLPAVQAQLHPGTTYALQNPSVWPHVATTVLLTSCSLYVSSLSTSGVKAVVLSLAAIFGVLLFAGMVRMTIWTLSPALLGRAASLVAAVFRTGDPMTGGLLMYAVAVASVGGLAAILLRFGMINHRSTRPGAAIIIRQLAVLVVLLTAGVFLLELVTVSRPRG